MVYVIWLRIEPLPGCKAVPQEFDPRLECALAADSPEHARELLDGALARDRYRVEEIEACERFDPANWAEDDDPGGAIRAAAAAAAGSSAPAFASFGRGPRPNPGPDPGR